MAIRLLLIKAGKVNEISTQKGLTLAAAVKFSGLVGEEYAQCGFNMECGTCAVKITPGSEPGIDEEMVLRSVGKDKSYRCACQIKVDEKINNAKVEIPY